MKRNILFFIVLWMSCCCAMAQSTITLKFTGKNQNNDWIPLSRVLVEDQTQRWQEMLYYPDTTLFAGTVGIEDHAQDFPVQLFQNVPNPFNGVTNFSLQLNEAQKVQLEIYDVDGKMMAQYQDFLPQGVHVFRANLTTPQTYLLSARTQDGIVHIKMVNTGRGGKNSIEYVGADGAMAWKLEEGTKGASPYPFQKGDRMKYVGYATLNGDEFVSEPIDKVQSNSETIPLTFTLPLPVVTTSDVISVTGNGAVSGGNVTSDGGATVTARGVCWSTSQSPTVSNNHTSDGTGTGGFTSNITGLAAGTSYYVRAYATTVMGTAYGAQKSFVTLTIPTVTTAAVSSITSTTAVSGGNVTSDGGAMVTTKGVCWSTNPNPTLLDSHTTDNPGSGNFTSTITGLSAGTTYYVRAYATNSEGTAYGNQVSFTAANVPTVTTTAISSITSTTAVSGGNVTSDGGATVTARGVCWSTSQNPTVSDSHTTSGTGTGSFTSSITSLTASTTYYVRAYATNSEGTAYGDQVIFTTANVPTVTTTAISSITSTTAVSGGNVTSDGGATVTARGVCWSTSQNPTVNNSHTTNGTGTGSFTSNMTGLSAGTTYYVRAYATNSEGTAYGAQVSFTTAAVTPTVTTTAVNTITSTTAKSGGNVTSDGGATVTARGVCWSTSQNPTVNNSHTTNGTGTGSFTSNMTGLSAGTTYYVRAYATNSEGTAYGDQVIFTTANVPTVTTTAISSITSTTAVSGGNVTSDGGATVTARGVCWSTNQNPTVSDSHTTNGTGTGSFTSNMTGLSASTTYYVRAYATNSVGTAYGSQISFTTSAASVVGAPCVGAETVTDHEGNVYNTVQIGEQCWTRENMRCTTSPSTGTTILEYPADSYSYTGKKAYYVNGNANNTAQYGLLYNWNAAVDTFNVQYGETSTNTSSSTAPSVTFSGNRRGICPQGWHVPSDEEWTTLTTYVGSQSHFVCGGDHAYIAKALASTAGWDRYTGTSSTGDCYPGYVPSSNNATGFSAVPAGSSYRGGYSNFGYGASFWSATQGSSACDYAIGRYMSDRLARFGVDPNTKFSGYVVRCLRDGGVAGGGGTTPSEPTATVPTVSTTSASQIAQNSAVTGGTVTADGGLAVTERGVCWSTTQNPTVDASHVAKGSGTGSFTTTISNLQAGTTYYVRAYATNSVGTAYGSQISFTTSAASVVGAPCVGAETVTDHEGNVYNTVQIGEQCWTKENMRCSTSPSTGTSILEYPASSYSYTGKKAYYVNGNANNTSQYGLLYNWCAAVDTFNVQYGETSTNTTSSNAPAVTFSGNRRGICPQGWHVPSVAEWTQLTDYVSNQSEYVCGSNTTYIAKALSSTTGWSSSTSTCDVGNTPANNNATGFTAVPAGNYSSSGYFGFGGSAGFWSATHSSSYYAYYRYLSYSDASVYSSGNTKYYGFSVRCLRD